MTDECQFLQRFTTDIQRLWVRSISTNPRKLASALALHLMIGLGELKYNAADDMFA